MGGGLAFVLFFDGLADTSATPAAFWRDTLVVWVAVLAVPFLHERVTWWNVAAIALLIVGQVAVAGGVGHLATVPGRVARPVRHPALGCRGGGGQGPSSPGRPGHGLAGPHGSRCCGPGPLPGRTGLLHALVSLDATQVGWALLTGLLLAAYVGTWMTALARARALDVTSILVGGALVTALLQAAAGSASLAPHVFGLALIALGTAVVVWMGLRHPAVARSEPVRP